MVRLTLENHFIWGDSHSSAENSCNVKLQGLCPDVKVVSLPWKLASVKRSFWEKLSWLENSHRRRQLAPWHPHSTPENYKYCIKSWELFVFHRTICFPIWISSSKLLTPVHFPPGWYIALPCLSLWYLVPRHHRNRNIKNKDHQTPTCPSFLIALSSHSSRLLQSSWSLKIMSFSQTFKQDELWFVNHWQTTANMLCMYLRLVSNGHIGCHITDLAHLGGKF